MGYNIFVNVFWSKLIISKTYCQIKRVFLIENQIILLDVLKAIDQAVILAKIYFV